MEIVVPDAGGFFRSWFSFASTFLLQVAVQGLWRRFDVEVRLGQHARRLQGIHVICLCSRPRHPLRNRCLLCRQSRRKCFQPPAEFADLRGAGPSLQRLAEDSPPMLLPCLVDGPRTFRIARCLPLRRPSVPFLLLASPLLSAFPLSLLSLQACLLVDLSAPLNPLDGRSYLVLQT
ncbi:hypothetical protein AB0G05_42625 [Nonomuraea wenchangensis]